MRSSEAAVRAGRGLLVAGLLAASCGGDGPAAPAPLPPPAACSPLPTTGGRHLLTRTDLGVANGGGQCRDRGGVPVTASAAGMLDARVTWSDPKAELTIEVWRGLLVERVAAGQREGQALCATVSLAVEPGTYTLPVCHTLASQLPISFDNPTRFELTVIYP